TAAGAARQANPRPDRRLRRKVPAVRARHPRRSGRDLRGLVADLSRRRALPAPRRGGGARRRAAGGKRAPRLPGAGGVGGSAVAAGGGAVVRGGVLARVVAGGRAGLAARVGRRLLGPGGGATAFLPSGDPAGAGPVAARPARRDVAGAAVRVVCVARRPVV